MPRLIILSGLPGTGKTTLARPLSQALKAAYLRVDSIEDAIRTSDLAPVEVIDHGYRVAMAVAADNLALGLDVVAECVNPWALTRDAWRQTALNVGAVPFEVELICSDADAHRGRVETRKTDIETLVLPTWQDVVERDYHPWPQPHIIVDTATMTPDAAVAFVLSHVTIDA